MPDEIFNNYNKGLYKIGTSVYSDPSLATEVVGSGIPVVTLDQITSGTSSEQHQQYVGSLVAGKQGFDNDESGYILGIDKGIPKFYIGNQTDYLNWDGTTLTINGTFVIGQTLITVSDISDLQPAIDTVEILGGGTVALVPGTYNATTSFTIPSGVIVDGNGSTIDFGGGAFQFLIQGSNAYTTGTLAATFNNANLVGTGTTWTSGMIGQSILIGDFWYTIATRTDNTHISISPNFQAPTVSGATYVIATTVDGVQIKNITLTNSSISSLKYQYLNGLILDSITNTDSAQGIDGDDSAFAQWLNGAIDNCTAGITFDNVRLGTFNNNNVTNITGGTGLYFNGVSNTSMGIIAVQDIVGVGIQFTNCFNFGVINYSIIECTSHGLEFVSANSAVDIESGYTDTVGGDGIKLTATSDGITIDAQTIKNYTGYGINIAASSCDNNHIGAIEYGGGGSGTINDSGTLTRILGDDTVYGSSWNGNLGTPTKNALYDKIESLGSGGGTSALITNSSSSNQNFDTTVTTSGAPKSITVYYKIDGESNGSGTLYSAGIAIFDSAGTIQANQKYYFESTNASVALTRATMVFDATTPHAGTAVGNPTIVTTVSIPSVTATGFTVRVAYSGAAGGVTGHASVVAVSS